MLGLEVEMPLNLYLSQVFADLAHDSRERVVTVSMQDATKCDRQRGCIYILR